MFTVSPDGWLQPSRIRRLLVGCLVALFLLTLTTPAIAATLLQQIVWSHEKPSTVARFVLLVSDESRNVSTARRIDLGKPVQQTLPSATLYSAIASFDPEAHVAVVAIGHDGQMSVPSGWKTMTPTAPGQPNLAGQ